MAVKGVSYWRCNHCEATLMDPAHWPSPAQEKATYDLHDNQTDDPGYRTFLGKMFNPLVPRLPAHACGLDFGCGPGPALAQMLADTGFQMALYDPLYYPDKTVLNSRYDFITCTEVVEHLHHPRATFAALDQMLEPGGLLAVMTCFQTNDAQFANWHYRRDPTHVVFYREHTMAEIAQQFGWTCEVPAKDVVLFTRPET
nr:class I SAM-dependent methyltransferase [Marinobacter caseinilyticus]